MAATPGVVYARVLCMHVHAVCRFRVSGYDTIYRQKTATDSGVKRLNTVAVTASSQPRSLQRQFYD